MNKVFVFGIILVVFVIIFYLNRHNIETFISQIGGNDINKINVNQGNRNDATIIDQSIQEYEQQKLQGAVSFLGNNRTQQLDELYENTETYENEEGREGLDICVEKCQGNCVEFGPHGRAFCFT